MKAANRQKIQSHDMHDTYTKTFSKAIYILMSSFPGCVVKKGNRYLELDLSQMKIRS